jgi:hypothetical protein
MIAQYNIGLGKHGGSNCLKLVKSGKDRHECSSLASSANWTQNNGQGSAHDSGYTSPSTCKYIHPLLLLNGDRILLYPKQKFSHLWHMNFFFCSNNHSFES